LQRDFIGIEIVEDYYKLAKKRIYDFWYTITRWHRRGVEW
jgi:hypothetical protein